MSMFDNIRKRWRKESISFSANEFVCNECNKKYRTKALFKQHMRREHEVFL